MVDPVAERQLQCKDWPESVTAADQLERGSNVYHQFFVELERLVADAVKPSPGVVDDGVSKHGFSQLPISQPESGQDVRV